MSPAHAGTASWCTPDEVSLAGLWGSFHIHSDILGNQLRTVFPNPCQSWYSQQKHDKWFTPDPSHSQYKDLNSPLYLSPPSLKYLYIYIPTCALSTTSCSRQRMFCADGAQGWNEDRRWWRPSPNSYATCGGVCRWLVDAWWWRLFPWLSALRWSAYSPTERPANSAAPSLTGWAHAYGGWDRAWWEKARTYEKMKIATG